MAESPSFMIQKYLIIGGVTKAATTSLFFYLADHPNVCAANWKEVRYFLDKDYPLPSKYRFEDGIEKYQEFFSHCEDLRLRVEATPDYLYSQGTPQKIHAILPDAKLVFILREPISRLLSWYRFAKQNNAIQEKTTFDEYVMMQSKKHKTNQAQHLLALEQGRYSLYLKPYYTMFGRDRINIVFYEDLSTDPISVLKTICDFAGIDGEFYSNYAFKVFNRTENIRSSWLHKNYIKVRFNLFKVTHDKPTLYSFLRYLKRRIDPLYSFLNAHPSENIVITPSMKDFLRDYYKEECKALEGIVETSIPWKTII